MKIIWCDDSGYDIRQGEKLLTEYLEKRQLKEIELVKYSDAEKLYKDIEKEQNGQIYILDMLMPEYDGISIGKLIREKQKAAVIIYVTSSEEYALQAYDVQAQRYLLKPLQKERFEEALDYALSITQEKPEPVYLINTTDGKHSVPYNQIEYIEYVSRKIYVNLINGKVYKSKFLRESFEENISELMNDCRFIQIHKSYVVNMEHIEKYLTNQVVMLSGSEINISKSRQKEMKRFYLEYLANRGRMTQKGILTIEGRG